MPAVLEKKMLQKLSFYVRFDLLRAPFYPVSGETPAEQHPSFYLLRATCATAESRESGSRAFTESIFENHVSSVSARPLMSAELLQPHRGAVESFTFC